MPSVRQRTMRLRDIAYRTRRIEQLAQLLPSRLRSNRQWERCLSLRRRGRLPESASAQTRDLDERTVKLDVAMT